MLVEGSKEEDGKDEMNFLRGLSSPNCVAVYDSFGLLDRYYCICMEPHVAELDGHAFGLSKNM